MIIVTCACLLVLGGCQRNMDSIVNRLRSLDSTGYKGQPASTAHIEKLKAAIEKYRKVVNAKVNAADSETEYYKMLALAYLDSKMYGLALDALTSAVRLEPANPVLFYYAGIAAGMMGKADLDPSAARDYFGRSEKSYRRALALDPNYSEAMYGLGVLLTFELHEPSQAEPIVKKLVSLQPNDTDAQFLLARIYVETGRTEDAARLYDGIAKSSKDPQARSHAEENRKQLLQRTGNG